MSTFKEYFNVILKGIPNADKVLEGVMNNLSLKIKTLPEDKKAEVIRRRVICQTCPFMSENAITSNEYLKLMGEHYHTNRTDKHCSLCACSIDNKTASFSSECGIGSYNENNPDKPIPLKWYKYE